jgi:transcription antitermination factor NusA-like protein
MVSLLKVGHIVSGIVAQTRPDYSAYLVFLTGTEIFAFLPHEYAKERYRVGADIVACIFLFERSRIVLTQTSSQYYRKVAEALFDPLIREEKIRIRRVAHVRQAGFVKIAIENLALKEEEFLKVCLPCLDTAKHYLSETVTLVRYRRDIHDYIREALVPAPKEKILKVIYAESSREARVTVEPRYLGKFLGVRCANVACAAKLLDIRIEITTPKEAP